MGRDSVALINVCPESQAMASNVLNSIDLRNLKFLEIFQLITEISV